MVPSNLLGLGMLILTDIHINRDSRKQVLIAIFMSKVDRDNLTIIEVYVHDIIFGSSDDILSKKFVAYMHSEFEMSLFGELKFFLGL